MMDHFEEKRGMVKMLMDMLKRSAADEVSGGMKAPETGKGLEIEKVSVIPHKDGDMSPEAATKMADGGMPAPSDEPGHLYKAPEQAADGSSDEEALKNLPGPVEDEEMERDEKQAMSNAINMDEDEDNNQSAFNAFLSRKKKK